MIIAMWPEPEVVEVQVEKVVEKLIVKEQEKSDNSIIQDTSIKKELERRELHDKN